MIINCKLGSIDCSSHDDIEKIIRNCAVGLDDIWVYSDTKYPCLAIPVSEEKAVVHYFSSEQGVHFQSAGNDDIDGTTELLAGGDKWEAPNYCVVSLSSAIECVKQFLKTQERPFCIEWDEI